MNQLSINQDRLNIIFVIGRKVEELSNITISLFGKIPAQQVSLLKHDDIVTLVRFSETHNKSLYWSTDAVDEIWHLISGHPYFTQCLCYHIWERLCHQEADEPPTVTLNVKFSRQITATYLVKFEKRAIYRYFEGFLGLGLA